jgi:hypothetical protein
VALHSRPLAIFFCVVEPFLKPKSITFPLREPMEDYEMKNGTATATYGVGDTEQVINPTEDNDLVQIGYKPELEVLRSICL